MVCIHITVVFFIRLRSLSLILWLSLSVARGIYRALTARLGLPLDGASLEQLSTAARNQSLKLFAATDGNHGRAVAWMAKILRIPAQIYVPSGVNEAARCFIQAEGAQVVPVDGEYDEAVRRATTAAATGGVLIQDTAFEGYEDVPSWIIDGYATLFREMEIQLEELGVQPTTIVTPVGVGSLAQAAIVYANTSGRDLDVVAVEPDTAPCLYESLRSGLRSVRTFHTIMAGMNCGTVSSTAWPYLRDYVNISTTVSDYESHCAVEYLVSRGISSGPCGASGLAALRRIATVRSFPKDAIILLLNTEGCRPYRVPWDISPDDPIELTRALTRIDSSNPALSLSGGAGESRIADYICAWLQHRDIETHLIEPVVGRPSVIGVIRGSGDGKSIMLSGHTDTADLATYASNALNGHLEHNRIHGRGVLDMKAGLAASMTAMMKARTSSQTLRGSVILTAVSDKVFASQGTLDVLQAGWTADGAIVTEPTSLELYSAHKGFVWVKVDILGVAAHGSDPAAGVDAIFSAGAFLTALEAYGKKLPTDRILGQGTMHCGVINGGEEPSSYPASCSVTVEFRTVSGQTSASILSDLEDILSSIARNRMGFRYSPPKVLFERPFLLPSECQLLIRKVKSAATEVMQKKAEPVAGKIWCDAALLSQAGIPAVVFGPTGEGTHSKEEWVDVASIHKVEAILSETVNTFCA